MGNSHRAIRYPLCGGWRWMSVCNSIPLHRRIANWHGKGGCTSVLAAACKLRSARCRLSQNRKSRHIDVGSRNSSPRYGQAERRPPLWRRSYVISQRPWRALDPMNTPTIPILMGLFTVGTLSHFSPQFTRPDVFFGVTVSRAFRTTEAARRILRDYRLAIWSSVAASSALIGLLPRPAVAFVIYAIGACGAQVVSHRRTSIHAAVDRSTAIEVDLSAPKEHLPGGFLGALLPFVALIGLGVWAVSHVDRLPDRLPIHWGFAGANRWVMTSPRAIIGILV